MPQGYSFSTWVPITFAAASSGYVVMGANGIQPPNNTVTSFTITDLVMKSTVPVFAGLVDANGDLEHPFFFSVVDSSGIALNNLERGPVLQRDVSTGNFGNVAVWFFQYAGRWLPYGPPGEYDNPGILTCWISGTVA